MIETSSGPIRRRSAGDLDIDHRLCTVRVRLERVEGRQLTLKAEETHVVRYFFPDELEHFLMATDFELVRLRAFPNIDTEPDESSWSVIAIARAA